MARHRRPVNVRDDGLTAVLGPLITVGGVERAVLLDVDSGMVLDAWACGEVSSSDSSGSAGGLGHGPASGAGSAQSDETVPGGATFGAGSAHGLAPDPGGASSAHGLGPDLGGVPSSAGSAHGLGPDLGGAGLAHGLGPEPGGAGSDRSDETVPGGVARPGFRSLWRSLRGADRPADAGVDNAGPHGDVEAFGARHADLVRALLALPGSPPAELSLVVDDRHHLLRCVADPAGGRLALAVVVAGSPWVVRRVRRHLRQLPDAGLTTGPWLLTWAVGPPPAPWPPVEPSGAVDGKPAARLLPDGPPPEGRASALHDGHAGPPPDRRLVASAPADRPLLDGHAGPPAVNGWPSPAEQLLLSGHSEPLLDERSAAAVDGRHPLAPAEWPAHDGWPGSTVDDSPHPLADGVPPPPSGEPLPEPVHDESGDPAAAVPDPRRGPAPPSALPPARSAGGR